MTDDQEIALAKRLPKGSRRAILSMTSTPEYPGLKTFNANAAHNLRWYAVKHGRLADYVIRDRRAAYYLTPLGERIKARVAQSDGNPKGQDRHGLGAEHDSGVGDSRCAQNGDRND